MPYKNWDRIVTIVYIEAIDMVLRDGSAVGRWTCDVQVAGSIPASPLSRYMGQLSLASLRGR